MARRYVGKRSLAERLESRFLLSGSYVVSEVSDIALDQPRIYYYLKRADQPQPIGHPDGQGGLAFTDLGFLDTGTSGNIESIESATDLGIQSEAGATFFDIGVGGGSAFDISEPLQIGVANFSPTTDVDNLATYQSVYKQFGPYRMEINPHPTGDGFLQDPINIIGMPEMMGKVTVLDPKPILNIDYMRSYIYGQGTPDRTASTPDSDPGIPATSLHVKLSYGDFAPFTFTDPSSADGPFLAPNPMIGPDPTRQFQLNPPPDNTPPVTLNLGNYSPATGSFLFDTGAQGSFISQALAGHFGVHYQPGTFGPGKTNPVLLDANNQPMPNQSVVPFGGLDGSIVYVAEFYLDSLTLQTQEGIPIVFRDAPVSVLDVALENYNTGGTFILDGDFGVNYWSATRNNFDSMAFNWVTFDQQAGVLGFAPSGTITPGTGSVVARKVFYNNSLFDGNNVAANNADDGAIATDKVPLLPGQGASTLANFTSYTKGINGIMVDIAGLSGTPTAADFGFVQGNSFNANNWTAVSAQASVLVRPGAGVNGSTRVEITWPDGSIRNQWLQVVVQADGNTGLSVPDVFYFGNLTGYSGANAPGSIFTVTAAEQTAVQGDPHSVLNPALVTNPHDYNRDGRVDAIDVLSARYNLNQTLVILSGTTFSAAPAATTTSAAAVSTATSAGTVSAANKSANLRKQQRAARLIAYRIQRSHMLHSLRHLFDRSALIRDAHTRANVQSLLKREMLNTKTAKLIDTFPLRVRGPIL